MACCIIAAYLFALFKAKLRQGFVFLGCARPMPGDDPDTIWRRAGRRAWRSLRPQASRPGGR